MRISSIAILFTMPALAFADPTVLPAPTHQVPYVPELEFFNVWSPILAKKPKQIVMDRETSTSRSPQAVRLCPVIDNPIQPFANGNIIVVVAGDVHEREEWAESARAHFGLTAFIYTDLFSVCDVATACPIPCRKCRETGFWRTWRIQ